MPVVHDDGVRRRQWVAILLVSLAGLLLEVGYTRIVSYKLWYYYTYLVIGLSLLGIGSGGVLVAVFPPLRRWSTDRIIGVCSLVSALVIGAGYLVIARIRVDTIAIWDYGTGASLRNLAVLAFICFVLFSAFIALGIIVSVLLGRAGDRVGRLYFADLVGAGLACLLAIPLITRLGPPRVIALSALVFALVAVFSLPRRSLWFAAACVTTLVLAGAVAFSSTLPDVRVENAKVDASGALFSEWGPVFRVDVVQFFEDQPNRLLAHDGTYGSGIWGFDGDPGSQTRFDTDPRAIPFQILDDPPDRELIIGSAGGQEILTSLYFGAPRVEAVELNPVTISLLTEHFADFTGHLADRPDVELHEGDGRSYLARRDDDYNLIWFVAPDSYAATNAASSGAFVLSESYLYTTEMIEEALEHLTDDGIMVVQFGELDFERSPTRTARYLATARRALENIGIDDPSRHAIVAAHLTDAEGDLSTVVLKRTPFTPTEVDAFAAGVGQLPEDVPVYAPGRTYASYQAHPVAQIAGGSATEAAATIAAYPREIDAISDDAPFFWHFSSFRTVLGDIFEPLDVFNPEDVIGERVLLLLLGLSIAYAAVFLLAPFVFVRRQWRALPAKSMSAVYFAALGLGFMFYEITMIQRLTRFLGYPTYSLTVTLAAILVSTGLGALLSQRFVSRPARVMPLLVGALAILTLFYQFGLDPLTDSLLSSRLSVRVVVSLLVLAPLGLCLGMFMPLGLARVGHLSAHGDQYVAWAWAVNGFFSVIGSVLTTILAMSYGFRAVQVMALGVYVIAALAFSRLRYATGADTDSVADRRDAHHRTAAIVATAASTANDGSAAARNRV
jgi:hypothetical protein